MKKLILKSLLFLIPFLSIGLIVEFYIRNLPNAFISKANYFRGNSSNIEVLFLGSSHSQNGINPLYIDKMSANISYGSQDVQTDSTLFFNNVNKMSKLKKVFFEIDYPRLDNENEKDFYRFPWYYIYYGAEIAPIKFINKFSLYSSNPDFFNNLIVQSLSKDYKKQIINKFGFVEENYTNEFSEMSYDSVEIIKTANDRLKERHIEISDVRFKRNASKIESIIKYCNGNNIDFYIVSTPMYFTYLENKIEKKDKKVKNYIKYLKSSFNIKHINLEESSLFSLKDFSNDDHLNAAGAKKYTLLLNEAINAN